MDKYYVVSYKQSIAHAFTTKANAEEYLSKELKKVPLRLALDFEVIKGEKLVFKPGSIKIEDQ